jgi:hypothetical protein
MGLEDDGLSLDEWVRRATAKLVVVYAEDGSRQAAERIGFGFRSGLRGLALDLPSEANGSVFQYLIEKPVEQPQKRPSPEESER